MLKIKNFKIQFKGSKMNRTKKVLVQCLSVGLASYIGAAHAADNAVLFKIHDINPIKNSDGIVTSCDLGATFFNRTGSEVTNATLNLVWPDDVVSDTIEQEQRAEKEAIRLSRRNVSRYSTSDYNDKSVSLNLKLPPLKPYQQVTMRTKVNTDRCFLLLNDVEINVYNCTTGGSGATATGGRGSNACGDIFRFVSVSNPEYYTEFSAVSMQEIQTQEQTQAEKEKSEVNRLFTETIDAINELANSFKDIDDGHTGGNGDANPPSADSNPGKQG